MQIKNVSHYVADTSVTNEIDEFFKRIKTGHFQNRFVVCTDF